MPFKFNPESMIEGLHALRTAHPDDEDLGRSIAAVIFALGRGETLTAPEPEEAPAPGPLKTWEIHASVNWIAASENTFGEIEAETEEEAAREAWEAVAQYVEVWLKPVGDHTEEASE